MARHKGREHDDHYGSPKRDEFAGLPLLAQPDTEPAVEAPKARAPRPAAPDAFLDAPAHQSSSPTSRAGAEAAAPAHRTKAYLVHQHIISQGKRGATRQEIADACAIRLATVCSLVNALYRQGDVASNPGHTRENPETRVQNEILVDAPFVERWQGWSKAQRAGGT